MGLAKSDYSACLSDSWHPGSSVTHSPCMTILGVDSTIRGVTGAETCINSLIRKSRAAFYADDYVKHTTHTTMKVNKKDTNIIEKKKKKKRKKKKKKKKKKS